MVPGGNNDQVDEKVQVPSNEGQANLQENISFGENITSKQIETQDYNNENTSDTKNDFQNELQQQVSEILTN